MTDQDAVLAVLAELGNESGDGIDQLHVPRLDELHHAGRRRHHFRERGDVEDRVFGHRLGRRLNRPAAEGRVVEDFVAAADQHDGAGEFLSGNRLVDQGRDGRKSGGGFGRRGGPSLATLVVSVSNHQPPKTLALRQAEGERAGPASKRDGGDDGGCPSGHAIQYILSAVTVLPCISGGHRCLIVVMCCADSSPRC
jgi:hypothetical protein